MKSRARLGLYLEDQDLKRRIKVAAAKRGLSTTAYCAQAIVDRLRREGELPGDGDNEMTALLARIDRLSAKIGPLGVTAAELVKEGRRR